MSSLRVCACCRQCMPCTSIGLASAFAVRKVCNIKPFKSQNPQLHGCISCVAGLAHVACWHSNVMPPSRSPGMLCKERKVHTFQRLHREPPEAVARKHTVHQPCASCLGVRGNCAACGLGCGQVFSHSRPRLHQGLLQDVPGG